MYYDIYMCSFPFKYSLEELLLYMLICTMICIYLYVFFSFQVFTRRVITLHVNMYYDIYMCSFPFKYSLDELLLYMLICTMIFICVLFLSSIH